MSTATSDAPEVADAPPAAATTPVRTAKKKERDDDHVITNEELRRIHGGLTRLSGRTLPDLARELKVAKLLREFFNAPFQATEDALQKLMKACPIPEDFEGTGIPRGLYEERETRYRDEVLSKTIRIRRIPEDLFIVEDDLPKERKTLPGNREGNADTINALGFLFKSKDDEDEDSSGNNEKEED